ncbi:MAG: hypothetical protein ACRDSJ_12350 [Rubrobacteraceae bacterium]
MDSGLWLLTLFAEPWGSFQLRDVHKTNVAWSSYPFLPPTTADGLLASVAGGQRWMEGNFHKPRSLRDLEWGGGLAALGGYPLEGDYARPHFRAHVNTLMSYDGPLWAPPKGQQSAGKKPAKVTDYLCERLRFVVAGNKDGLEELWEKVIGRVSPFAKKSVLYLPYEQSPDISPLSSGEATTATESLTALPMVEMGSMPRNAHPYLTPVKSKAESKGKGYKVTWSHLNCIWEPGVKVRQGTSLFIADNGSAISKSLLEAILEE